MYRLVIVIIALFVCQAAMADDMDMLNEFDNIDVPKVETPKPAAAKSKSFGDQLYDNFGGKTTAKYYHFLVDIDPVDNRKDDSQDFFNAKIDFHTKYASPRNVFTFKGWAETGNEKDTYQGLTVFFKDSDRHSRYLEISELSLVHTYKDLEATIGKKPVPMGLSTIYSPTNKITVRDLNDPTDSKEIGVWQLRGDFYKKDYAFTFVFLPSYSEGKTPSERTRWTGTAEDESADYDFSSASASGTKKEIVAVQPKNFSYLGRVKTTLKGWDVYLAGFYGVSPYSVLRKEVNGTTETYYKEHPIAAFLSAGFSTTYKKYEFHGESLLQASERDKDDTFSSNVIGTTYNIDDWAKKVYLERISMTVEYAKEFVVDEQHEEGYVESSKKQREGQNDIIGRFDFKVNEDLNFEYIFSRNFKDSGHLQKVGANYKIVDNLNFKTYAEFFDGPKDSYYGRWRKNDRWINTLEYTF